VQTTEVTVTLVVTDARQALNWLFENAHRGGIVAIDDNYLTDDEGEDDRDTEWSFDRCGLSRNEAYECERPAGHDGMHFDGHRNWSA
jgi:hypothetical protein